jgi:imidazoleglycerol phosphate dehydratase HisB
MSFKWKDYTRLVSAEMTLLSNYDSSYSSGRNDHHQYEKMFRITGNAVLHFSSFRYSSLLSKMR